MFTLVTARNDFFAVGVGGIASSIVSSMPVSGCFSRSSLNFESNAATQLGNIITAVVVLISALLFAENFRYAGCLPCPESGLLITNKSF